MTDFRLAARMIARQPGMAVLAVVALALGIGLTTTMFSIVNGAIIRGLPFPESDRIYHIAPFNTAERRDTGTRAHTFAEFGRRQRSFEQLAAFRFGMMNVAGSDGIPERYRAAWITANTLRLLRVAPAMGRDFRGEESRSGAAPVAIIGHKVWQERFKGAPGVVGQPLRIDGAMVTVVGVMAPGFGFPQTEDVWMPAVIEADAPQSATEVTYQVIGRLGDGVSPEQAKAEMTATWNQLVQGYPDRYDKGFTIQVQPYVEEVIGREAVAALYTMLVAVLGVLVIACANVANLVLARAAGRTREVAVRTAVGATRWQVIRQMLAEVLVLAVAGALAGLGIASAGITLFNRGIADTNPPFWIDVRIDGTVLAFVTTIAVIAAFAAGMVPALRASRIDISAVLNDQGRGATGLRIGRLSRGLVMIEMALSFGLLVVAALSIQSIMALSRMDFGFATADVWVGRVALPEQSYKDDARRRQFADALLDRLRAVPGVESAALATNTPLGAPRYPIALPGSTHRHEREYPRAWGITTSPDYFRVLRAKMRKGRPFDARDQAGVESVAIVNESFERKYFPQGAIGRQFAVARGDERPWRTIVGVVPDSNIWSRHENQEGFYLALAQAPVDNLAMMLDTSGPPLGVTAAVRHAVRELDPNVPVSGVNTLEGAILQNTWGVRVFGTLFMAFGFSALFLAMVGLYGVMSFSVRRRTQEIGVRMAIGATRGDVLRMVLRHGIVPVAAGMTFGIGLGALLSNALRELVFNMNPHDPATFAGIGFVLLLTGLAACLVPARRAAAVDPIEALRYQ